MHTWALFSCSSLVTLTAYNLSLLPQAQTAGPEPEPDSTEKFADGSKFSLEALSQEYPEYQPAIALPPLPDQPQMSKLDEIEGYNPAIYDADRYPVKEVDLAAMLEKESLSYPVPDQVVTYRSEAVRPLPESIPAPLPAPQPVSTQSATAIAAAPQPAAIPQAEPTAAAPAFTPATAVAQVPTTPTAGGQSSPTATPATVTPAPVQEAAGNNVSQASASEVTAIADTPDSTELFAALPAPTVPTTAVDHRPPAVSNESQVSNLMAEQNLGEPVTLEETSPASSISMAMVTARRQLVQRYCERVRDEAKEDSKLAVCEGDTKEFAQRMPEAATAGTPMPGNVESPTRNNPAIGVL